MEETRDFVSQMMDFDEVAAAHASKGVSSDNEIDCRRDPDNFRPAIDAIMAQAKEALQSLDEDKTLVILIGENHSLRSHPLFQQALIEAHKKQQDTDGTRFAVGYEKPHNYRETAKIDSPERDEWASGNDPDGVKSMNAFNAKAKSIEAKQPNVELFDYCKKNGIPVSFNDLAYKKSGFFHVIDKSDIDTHDIVMRHRPDLMDDEILRVDTNNFNADLGDGIALSNSTIAEKASADIERKKARVYIQQCGIAHIFGDSTAKASFEDSLYSQLKDRGFTVLPVIPNIELVRNRIPVQAEHALKEAIKIAHMQHGGKRVSETGYTRYEDLRNRIRKASEFNFDH